MFGRPTAAAKHLSPVVVLLLDNVRYVDRQVLSVVSFGSRTLSVL